MKETQPTLRSGLVVAGASARWTSFPGVVGVLGCCLLMSLAAQVRIPLPGTDVPMTLQTLGVLLAGFALGPTAAATAMLLYLGAGVAGLPAFFPGSLGLAGPTGGYIIGFVPGAWLVSLLKGGSEARFLRLLTAGAVGMAAVFGAGVAWRVPWCGGSVWLAVTTGLVPFVAKAVVELLLAVTLVASVRGWRRACGRCCERW